MKIRTWCFAGCLGAVGLLAGCSERSGDENGFPETVREGVFPDSVRQELVRLGAEDQEVRQDLSPERLQDTVFARAMLRGDSIRTARLRTIVQEYGWPDSMQVGPRAASAAFLILQHSPVHEFQKEILPVVEERAKRGIIPADQAALLIDRVLMREDLPQRYGTQFKMVEGRWVLHPVEDEGGLEARRKSMGLPSMEEYMRVMEEAYNAPVVRRP